MSLKGSRQALACLTVVVGTATAAGCSSDNTGPQVEIDVGALTLPGLADACYTLRVENGDDEIVWEKTGICADRFGDGRSAISYVGPCDASAGVSDNRVTLILETLHDGSGEIGRDTYENPCGDGSVDEGDAAYNFDGFGPCQRTFVCQENADVAVDFDITVMRDAGQGFFDIAVNFEDIFCSAKVDCNDPDTGATNLLLHNPATDDRDATAVAALACYSGTAQTVLHMEDVRIVCGSTTYLVDPTGGPGNLELDEGNDPVLFAAAVYEGVEPQQGQGMSFWNVALGIDETTLPATGCTIEVRATASEGSWGESAGYIPATHTNYPVLTASIDLSIVAGELQCGAHAVNAEPSDYRTAYASTGRFSPHIFCHELVPGAADLTSTLPNCGVTNLFIGDDGGNAALQIDGGIYSAEVPPDAFVDGNGDDVDGTITMIVSPDGFNGSYGVQGGTDGEPIDPEQIADFTFVDENANEVSVAPDTVVTIRIPLPPESLYLAGDAIDFYSWDQANNVWVFETTGLVVQEGGSLYAEGAVSHFTWYGVQPSKKACVNVSVVDGSGQPLDGVLVRSVVLPASGAYYQASTAGGQVCLQTRAQGYKASIQMPSLPAGATVSPALPYTTPAFAAVAACGSGCLPLTFTVTLPSACNGDYQPGEECDGGAYCDTNCTCEADTLPLDDGGCTLCGNGLLDGGELCDPLFGSGDNCRADTCECDSGYDAIDGDCVPQLDGLCADAGDLDCDNVCNTGDSAPDCNGTCDSASEDGSNDCNLACDANEGGSNDCNTLCQGSESQDGPDCNGTCQPGEDSASDCNTLCNGGEDGSSDCDLVCQPNEDGPDCNNVCDSFSEAGSNDCNNVCDADEAASNDCNTQCQGSETSAGPDCDGVCQFGEDSPNDCNTLCNANEAGSNDCNSVCNPGDDGPDCDTFCGFNEEGSNDCNLVCNAGDEGGPDCNSICDANEGGSGDCNTWCDNGAETLAGPDCDGHCQPGDVYGTDCDNLCDTGDVTGSNDCNNACDAGETGPDCNGDCASGETGDDCDGSCQPGDEGSNDCDWNCIAGEDGSTDCDTYCNNSDTLTGPDCDGVCQAGENSTVDCDTFCGDDEGGSNDCNTYCDQGDGGPDCDDDCDSGDALPGPDCNNACAVGETGPDCDGTCNVGDAVGSNDCNTTCNSGEEGSVDCDGGCDQGDTGAGECNGVCQVGELYSDDCDYGCDPNEAGSTDCDSVCNGSDALPSPDCDGTCLAAEGGSADCNGTCQPGDTFYLECNYVCEATEAGSTDCDGYCSAGEYAAGGSPDCTGPCTPSDAGSPVCDGTCDAGDTAYVDGGPDCNNYCASGEAGTSDCNDSCENGDAAGSADCNDKCESNDWAGPDCEGDCDLVDEGGSVDCQNGCEPGDVLGSHDCNGDCDFDDKPGSVDCDTDCELDDYQSGGDCNGSCQPGDEVGTYDCDGRCRAGEVGSIDCDLDCDPEDTVAGGDCNNVCDPADNADGVDCNERCSTSELPESPDCDEICQPGEVAASTDCNELCDGSTGEESGSGDCNGACQENEFYPDCDGSCEGGDYPGTYDCDGTCEPGDIAGSADCNGACDGLESTTQGNNPDCNGYCDNDGENANDCNGLCEHFGNGEGEIYGSEDCDEVCTDYAENGSDDCDGVCEPDEQFGPDCDGTCDNDDHAEGADCLLIMQGDAGGTVVAFTLEGNFSVVAPPEAFVAPAFGGVPVEGEILLQVNPNPSVGNYALGGGTLDPETIADIHFYSEGNPVQVADGANVTVVMPLPGTTSYLVGDEVDVYYYDTTTSTWMFEVEGTVVASGDGLGVQFTATHFSIFAVPASPTNVHNRMAGIEPASSCFLTPAGVIACPGDRTHGLHLPPTDSGFVSLAVGREFGCALHGLGTITCWGEIASQVVPSGSDFVQVTSGDYHACALNSTGNITCWAGGLEPYEGYENLAVLDAPSNAGYREVTSTNLVSCALDSVDALTCWGHSNMVTEPPVVPTGLRQLAAVDGLLCALDSTDMLVCFGDIVGSGLSLPTLPMANVALLRMGGDHLTVLRNDGTIGHWSTYSDPLDTATPPSGNDFTAIGTTKCAMRADGSSTCWGWDTLGGLARRNDGQKITTVAPGAFGGYFLRTDGSIDGWQMRYPAPSGAGYTQLVSDAGNHYCALKPNKEAVCWGDTGLNITPAAGEFTQLAAASGREVQGAFFKYKGTFCGLRTNGTLACWGSSDSGTTTPSLTTPPTGNNFVSVWGSDRRFCAVRSGNLGRTCWGTGNSNPVTLYGEYNIKKLAGFSCILRTNGTLTCTNPGNGAPPSGGGFVDIAEGFDERFCAVHESGSLSCWHGGTPDAQVIFPTGNDFVAISGSVRAGLCGIRSNGRVSCAKRTDPQGGWVTENIDLHP